MNKHTKAARDIIRTLHFIISLWTTASGRRDCLVKVRASSAQTAYRTKRVLNLGSLLVLGSAWILQGLHISPETPTLTQNDFNLGRVSCSQHISFVISVICVTKKTFLKSLIEYFFLCLPLSSSHVLDFVYDLCAFLTCTHTFYVWLVKLN